MEYMTVREAAEKWNITPRLVQQCCAAGQVSGAQKFSGAWAIPAGAARPADSRKHDPEEERGRGKVGLRTPMPLMNTPFAPGHAMAAVESFQDPELRRMALAEYYYFNGRAELASEEAEPFLHSDDLGLCVSACWVYGYANLATGQIHKTRYALARVREIAAGLKEDTPPQLCALVGAVYAGAAVLLHLPLPEGVPPMEEYLRFLPPGLQFFALYVRAHHTYLQHNYAASIGIVETALALQPEVYPIPTIYLHLVATMDYMSLKQPDQAKKHLLAAWELARPDDLIEAFGEHHGLLGGMLESVIKKDWPEDFKRMIAVTYTFSAGWRKIHNPDTGSDVADNLTTTEFATAMLAARDWTNQEIACHMGVSTNTVKRHISTALQKLNITQRKELKKFMLE